MQTGSSGELRSTVGATDTRGKHRVSAELKRLEQETRFFEEELEQLEKMEKASAACKEMLSSIETRSDPLLPVLNCTFPLVVESAIQTKRFGKNVQIYRKIKREEQRPCWPPSFSIIEHGTINEFFIQCDSIHDRTNGPINPIWDRWFEGPQDSSGCRCRIL